MGGICVEVNWLYGKIRQLVSLVFQEACVFRNLRSLVGVSTKLVFLSTSIPISSRSHYPPPPPHLLDKLKFTSDLYYLPEFFLIQSHEYIYTAMKILHLELNMKIRRSFSNIFNLIIW